MVSRIVAVVLKIEFGHAAIGPGIEDFLADHDNIGIMPGNYRGDVPQYSPAVISDDPDCRALRYRFHMPDAITGDRTRVRSLGSSCPTARLLSHSTRLLLSNSTRFQHKYIPFPVSRFDIFKTAGQST